MILSVFLATLNHLLAQQPLLSKRLQAHAGQQLAVYVGGHLWTMHIDSHGYFQKSHSTETTTLTITLPLALVPALLQRDELALRQLPMVGDLTLAQSLAYVLRHLHWDLSASLSPWLGDLFSQRLSDTTRQCHHWQQQVRHNTLRQLADYLTEEVHLLPTPVVVDEWLRAVDALPEDVARLEARLNALEKQLPHSS